MIFNQVADKITIATKTSSTEPMHTIEPFYSWQKYYDASRDPGSPFYGNVYSESVCSATVYNYYIHPQWDDIGSSTLYVKLLFVQYDKHLAIIELLGEWNDILHNDVMYLKRNLADPLIGQGIIYFILIGENVMNFHAADDDYYAEWYEETEGGWIAAINLRNHVNQEFKSRRLGRFLNLGEEFNDIHWRSMNPIQLANHINSLITKRLEE